MQMRVELALFKVQYFNKQIRLEISDFTHGEAKVSIDETNTVWYMIV